MMVNDQARLKFNIQFFRDFWRLLLPYWKSNEKWSALLLLFLNIICTIVGVRASVAMNNFNKEFFDALQNFNKSAITTSLLHFTVIITVMILALGYSSYFNGLLSIRWRRWLTSHYLNKWLSDHNHYRMHLLNLNVDNPDQRIGEDLEKFPTTTLSVIFLTFEALLVLISFGYILWNLSGSLAISLGYIQFNLHGYLFWGAVVYGLLGTWITGWIGKRLANFDYQQQKMNADLRFSLIRLRESSEQIALYNGELAENAKFASLFERIYGNYKNIITLNRRLAYFSNGHSIISFILGIFMAVPLYLQKKIQLGGMMQISSAFGSVIGAFSRLVYGFSIFAEWRAVVSRLLEFDRSLDIVSQTSSNIKFKMHNEDEIIISNLALTLPDGRPLIRNLNLTLQKNNTYLLTGRSGLGKSTLLRAIANLWTHGEGVITVPKKNNIFFLPQKPYLPLGSLKDVLLYPSNKNISDVDLYHVLEISELNKFRYRLDDIKNWSMELSLGEQQKIGFARIFLQVPDIIFLDEATSALDEASETILYEKLTALLYNATIISVGHRRTLQKFHKKIISLSYMNNLSTNISNTI